MTGQDWFEKDFYAMLGVPKDADADAIKKAYRAKARALHPDRNPGDEQAEQKFKEIGEAYAVLSDPEQRSQYDAVRAMAGGGARFTPGADGASAEDLFSGIFGGGAGPRVRYSTSQAGGFEDLFGGIFGGGGGARPAGGFGGFPGFRRGPERGADLQATTTLGFRQAVEGDTVTLGVEGRTVTTRIPAGVQDGQRIRLRGKGRPGTDGGEPGDLILTVSVEKHPVFTVSGRDLKVTVPVTFAEAALGAEVQVPTLTGEVTVKVPAGTPSGRTLRVKGRGIAAKAGTGDLLATVQITVPQRLTSEARAAVEAFAEATPGDVRSDLFAQAKV